jgi:hypothetical protein
MPILDVKRNDEFGVTQNGEVGAVCRDHYLPALLCAFEVADYRRGPKRPITNGSGEMRRSRRGRQRLCLG